MREVVNVPEDDQFMTIGEHNASSFRYGASCFSITRSDDVAFIQITVFKPQTMTTRRARTTPKMFRVVLELSNEPTLPNVSKAHSRLAALVRIVARQAAKDFVLITESSQKRDGILDRDDPALPVSVIDKAAQ